MYNKEYYGLLVKNGRTRIDVKRMMVTCYLDEDIYNVINKPRKTVYYLPERVKRHDYMVNIFKDAIEKQRKAWNEELMPVIKK